MHYEETKLLRFDSNAVRHAVIIACCIQLLVYVEYIVRSEMEFIEYLESWGLSSFNNTFIGELNIPFNTKIINYDVDGLKCANMLLLCLFRIVG